MNLQLKDKIAIVTGASGAIGSAICKAFLQEGVYVTGVYKSNASAIKNLLAWCSENNIPGEKWQPLQADLSQKNTAENIVEKVLQKNGRIDVLVNAAGITFENLFLMTEDEDWERIWQVNFLAAMQLCRQVLAPMMQARKGAIVNISSVLAGKYGRGAIAYAVSKAAIERFTQTLALETGKKGIRVNVVCPGIIQSAMAQSVMQNMGNKLLENTPLNRFGQANEIANAVLFLASESAASFITGQKICVDGGLSI